MAWSWRTIFLLIRGIDQTGRAFEKPKRELSELQKRQQALARSAYRLLFAGAAFLAFGLMAAKALSGLFTMTSKGKLMTDDLRRAWTRMATSVAEQITQMLGPAIEDLTRWLDNLADNPFYSKLLALGAGGIVGLSLLGAAISVIGFAAKTAGLIALKFGVGALAFEVTGATGAGIAGAAAGTGLKAMLLAKIGGMFSGITGAVASLGAGGVLAIAIPIVLTLMIAKTLLNWYGMTHEEQVDWATRAGEKQAAWREKMGISDEQYYADQARAEAYRQMGITGDINIDIYGNTFPYDMDEAALAAELGYNIHDKYSNLSGAVP